MEDLLLGIVSDPHEEDRYLVLSDWLEECDDPRRADLLRLLRKLLDHLMRAGSIPREGGAATRSKVSPPAGLI